MCLNWFELFSQMSDVVHGALVDIFYINIFVPYVWYVVNVRIFNLFPLFIEPAGGYKSQNDSYSW